MEYEFEILPYGTVGLYDLLGETRYRKVRDTVSFSYLISLNWLNEI
jgi:hypothetical protein